ATGLHFTMTDTGTEKVSLDGRFGMAKGTNNLNCTVGQLNVTTKTPMQAGSSGQVTSGVILLQNSSGQKAEITYNSNGIEVRMNGGSNPIIFKNNALKQFCNLG